MPRNIDVMAEMRKFADRKPVHAVARATGAAQAAQSRATGAVQTARAKASDGYDTLAAHGKKAMNGEPGATKGKSTSAGQSKAELNGKPKAKAPTRSTTSR